MNIFYTLIINNHLNLQKYAKILLLFFVVLIASCLEEPPTIHEGNTKFQLYATGDTSLVDSIPDYIPLAKAKVILFSEYGMIIRYTDNSGNFSIEGIPSATYRISIRLVHPQDPNLLLVGNLSDVEINSGKVVRDTIIAKKTAGTGICINEIYCGGPVNNVYFFYDQYLELYNYSDSTKYLDGAIVMRVSGNSELGILPGEDFGNDGDIDGVTYIFKFPGKAGEKNYQILPGQFKVLAVTAVNHKNVQSTSIDLSTADWEFYNQYSASDFDNPNVPNLSNLRSDRTVDFLINLVSDVIVIANGVDTVWSDGIDISTIIDGVEYQSSTSSLKTLDVRVDKSFVLSPPKYGGLSMQRREQGGDSNDGLLDWMIISHPTPGKQF
jgi:hypothetical protein